MSSTKVCVVCFNERPKTEFTEVQPCDQCLSDTPTEKRAEFKHAQHVRLNRLLNSIPAPRP